MDASLRCWLPPLSLSLEPRREATVQMRKSRGKSRTSAEIATVKNCALLCVCRTSAAPPLSMAFVSRPRPRCVSKATSIRFYLRCRSCKSRKKSPHRRFSPAAPPPPVPPASQTLCQTHTAKPPTTSHERSHGKNAKLLRVHRRCRPLFLSSPLFPRRTLDGP